jgi:outer membrane protein OmpA-like peptidoglycan-associated protein
MKCYPLILFTLTYSFTAFSQQKTTDSLVLHFEYNRSTINPIAVARLDSFMTTVPAFNIKQVNLYGHCDFIGSNKYNDSLSLQRVLATKTYLVTKGVNTALFTEETGFGKRKPLDLATTDTARAINRRVEIIITKEIVMAPPSPLPVPAVEAMPVTKTPLPTLSEMIKDSSVKAGSKLIIPNLIFEGGRHFLQQSSYPIVQELLKIMQDNPNLVIEIQGHVCCQQNGVDGRDDDLRTNDLSVQRAKVIYEYLVDKGIDSSRMFYRGFGSSQKIYPQELTPEQMAQNRRVEIKIIRK